MKRMTSPSDCRISSMIACSRSSNSPRNLRARDQRAHVQRQHALVPQVLRHVAGDDLLRQAFDDRGLADAGLTDDHRVVLACGG